MAIQKPEAQTMKISEVKRRLSSLVDRVSQRRRTRILIERSSAPVAALVSVDDLARLEQFDREWDEGTKAIKRISQAFADVPVEELEAEVARAIDEVRRQSDVEAERQPA